MKNLFFILSLVFLASACGNNTSSTTSEQSTTTAPAEAPAVAANTEAELLDMMGKSDCNTCHKISDKLIGPTYKEVAVKYAGQDTAVAYLTKKILEGGVGVWGQVPMTPHTTLTKEDAEKMVHLILALK